MQCTIFDRASNFVHETTTGRLGWLAAMVCSTATTSTIQWEKVYLKKKQDDNDDERLVAAIHSHPPPAFILPLTG